MTTLTLRYIKGDFAVTGPDIEPLRFKTRREAKDWCRTHYPGSLIKEIDMRLPPKMWVDWAPGDMTKQIAIEGAIDRAEGPMSNRFDDLERSPLIAVHLSDAVEHLQFFQDGRVRFIGHPAPELGPVDSLAV